MNPPSLVIPVPASALAGHYLMRPVRDHLTGSLTGPIWFTRETSAGGRGVAWDRSGCHQPLHGHG